MGVFRSVGLPASQSLPDGSHGIDSFDTLCTFVTDSDVIFDLVKLMLACDATQRVALR